MDKAIKQRIEKIDNPDAVRLYFRLIKILIDDLGLGSENPKLSLTVPTNQSYFATNLNSRYALILNGDGSIGFMIREDDFAELKRIVKCTPDFRFSKDNVEQDYFVSFLQDKLKKDKTLDAIVNFWLKSCREYEPKMRRSCFRKSHNAELYDLASHEESLEVYLN